ncbi:hypothetical protein LINGRAHAP2_LOCUS22007, partial [Linum grandiflorum]
MVSKNTVAVVTMMIFLISFILAAAARRSPTGPNSARLLGVFLMTITIMLLFLLSSVPPATASRYLQSYTTSSFTA